MILLHKRERSGRLLFRQIWIEGEELCRRDGEVGAETPTTRRAIERAERARGEDALLNDSLRDALGDGFDEPDMDDYELIELVWPIQPRPRSQTALEHEKTSDQLRRIEKLVHEALWRCGVGGCEGTCTGRDLLAVCCSVIDIDLAEKVIERAVAGTEVADRVELREI